MSRRALVVLTALVLALHWAVLTGLPWAWEVAPAAPVAASAARVFSTRSVTIPPPPAPPAPPPIAALQENATAPAAPPQPKPKPKPRPRPRPVPAPPPEPAAPVTPPEAAPPADPLLAAGPAQAGAEMPGEPVAMSAAGQPTAAEPVDPAAVGASDSAGALADVRPAAESAVAESAAAAASAPAAPSPAPPSTAAGIDIALPGAAADAGGAVGGDAALPPPVRLPPPLRLAFDVSGQARKFTYNARAELVWQHDGNRYEARQEVGAFLMGSRAQRSTGALTAQGLQPQRFGDKSRSERAAHFDHAGGRVTFSANTPEAPIGPGAQDRLSVFIQLGAMLAADPARFVPGTRITLTTVSARGADRWTFTVEGPETLELPAGTTAALKLQRLPRKEYDQKAELWLAPALGYLPVRIQLTQANGDFADLRLSGSSTLP